MKKTKPHRLLADMAVFIIYSISYIWLMTVAAVITAGEKMFKLQKWSKTNGEKHEKHAAERERKDMKQMFMKWPINSTVAYNGEFYRILGYEVCNDVRYLICTNGFSDVKINVENLLREEKEDSN